jgi:hypothetical protein
VSRMLIWGARVAPGPGYAVRAMRFVSLLLSRRGEGL